MRQDERYSRFMAGKSLERYIELHRGEYAYNKGNSKTFPYGCVYRLTGYEKAAVPHVYYCFKSRGGIDEEYFAHFFLSGVLNDQLARINNSGVRHNGLLNVSAKEFFRLKVAVPPLSEQRRISEILDSIEEAIQAAQAVIEQTRTFKQGMLEELLTRGLGHARFEQTEIGEVPERWEVRRLADLIPEDAIRNGLYKPSSDYGEGTPIIRIDAFQNGDVIGPAGLKRVQVTSAELATFGVQNGDVLINRVNSLSHLGKVGIVGELEEPTVFESNMMCIRLPREAGLLPKYLLYILASQRGRSLVRRSAKQAVAQASINQQDVRSFVFAIPPVWEQQKIIDAFTAWNDAVTKQEGHLRQLNSVKRGVMQALMMG